MVGAVAGAAAAFSSLTAAGVFIRRHLAARARISRRLDWKHGHKIAHFCFHAPSLPSWMAEDADPA
jgi:hypothetical protein